jgi:hypothetical protein
MLIKITFLTEILKEKKNPFSQKTAGFWLGVVQG